MLTHRLLGNIWVISIVLWKVSRRKLAPAVTYQYRICPVPPRREVLICVCQCLILSQIIYLVLVPWIKVTSTTMQGITHGIKLCTRYSVVYCDPWG